LFKWIVTIDLFGLNLFEICTAHFSPSPVPDLATPSIPSLSLSPTHPIFLPTILFSFSPPFQPSDSVDFPFVSHVFTAQRYMLARYVMWPVSAICLSQASIMSKTCGRSMYTCIYQVHCKVHVAEPRGYMVDCKEKLLTGSAYPH